MDFRLRVFAAVARHLNFTKAANELHISQPAISKHIQELESAYGVRLFERAGHRITLTPAGEAFLKHAEQILEEYRLLGLEMNLHSGNFSGMLRIGASTTIAQYVIPEIVAKFIQRFPDIRLTLFSGNSEQIEQELAEHRIDLGLVESSSRHAGLKYSQMGRDELVLVTSSRNRTKEEVSVGELKSLPLVLRETGSGTLEVIEKSLLQHNIKLTDLTILLQIGSTEGIKNFLVNCPSAYAIVSIAALSKELLANTLQVVEIEGVAIQREFAFVVQQGSQNNFAELFMRFVNGITKVN